MPTVAFVMEQALGHVTHTKNLQQAVGDDPDVDARWNLIEFPTRGWAGRVPVYRSNWTVRAGLRARRRLKALARATHLDAVYFHTQVPAVFARSWMRRLPSIVSLDATPLQYDQLGAAYGHAPGPAWLESLKYSLNRSALDAAAGIVAFSEWTKRGLVEGYGVPATKIAVIGPGIDLPRWRFVPREGRSGQGPLKILFVGADFERKGGPLLLEAFDRIADLGAELHVVTRANLPPRPGVVVHRGLRANDPALIQLYEEADVFCLPTRADALGWVFCEAGASGLPSIATDVGAIREVVLDGQTGILIRPGDLDALVAGLRSLLTDEAQRLHYGRAARAHIERHFDNAVNTRRVLGLCKDVTAAAPNRTS